MTHWLTPLKELSEQIRKDTELIREENERLEKEIERLERENEALRSLTPEKISEIVKKSIKKDTL
jgi:hypothetical protein